MLIFPKPALYLLSWVALAPLIYSILKCREQDVTLALDDGGQFLAPATPWQGFLLGYASGVVWYLGSCYWIFHVMHSYGGLGVATSAVLLVLFALYLALYHGLFGLLLALIAARRNGYSLRALVFTPFVMGSGRAGANLHHRLSVGSVGYDADRQYSALTHRLGNRRLWHLV